MSSLIDAHEKPGSPIDEPVLAAAAELVGDAPRAVAVGQMIGHYQVIAPIGKGGMGEVYLANDIQLDRKVALKLLPAEFTITKCGCSASFRKRGSALRSITQTSSRMMEIGQADGTHFLATEFIDGQTLKQRMHYRMELWAVLEVGSDRRRSTGCARCRHRPPRYQTENIMLDGRLCEVSILGCKDHRKVQPDEIGRFRVVTMAKAYPTPGTVLGTVNYMSPDRRAEVLDERTDVSASASCCTKWGGSNAICRSYQYHTLVAIWRRNLRRWRKKRQRAPGVSKIISKALRRTRKSAIRPSRIY